MFRFEYRQRVIVLSRLFRLLSSYFLPINFFVIVLLKLVLVSSRYCLYVLIICYHLIVQKNFIQILFGFADHIRYERWGYFLSLQSFPLDVFEPFVGFHLFESVVSKSLLWVSLEKLVNKRHYTFIKTSG